MNQLFELHYKGNGWSLCTQLNLIFENLHLHLDIVLAHTGMYLANTKQVRQIGISCHLSRKIDFNNQKHLNNVTFSDFYELACNEIINKGDIRSGTRK